MNTTRREHTSGQRLFALLLAALLVFGMVPVTGAAETTAENPIDTVADLPTLTRPTDIYGNTAQNQGHTQNAGKVTVGKSVSDSAVTIGSHTFTPAENNFMVTISQSAQVMGLTSETSVPVDVVFVLDTSGSMEGDRAKAMVNAANTAIKTLMAANEDNRVSVVAFSSAAAEWNDEWRDWGQGTSDGAAANLLSPLAHYDDNTSTTTTADDAASNHLRWANSDGTASSNGVYILGRGDGKTAAGYRRGNHEDAGGTNIHAGIALGAQQLMKVTDTTVTYEDGTTVTRMPFIIVLSDGAPTFASSSTNWYNPSQTNQNGDGNTAYTGNGFLAALTAAYYKGAITDRYYGTNADNNNRCNIYTIGVSVGNNSLANLTLNPKENFNANATGTNHGGRFASYWESYNSNNLNNGFTVNVNDDQNFRITNASISATKNFVTGKNADGTVMYTEGTGITYNDGYYSATQTSQIAGIFQTIVTEISKKAISSPTHVGSAGEDFSGYVNFYDPIGEYMEVKDMKGILADNTLYQGRSFSQKLYGFTNSGSQYYDAEFNAMLAEVLNTRLSMTGSNLTAQQLITAALASPNQAYYNASTGEFDNSIVWWGDGYTVEGEEDPQVQALAPADNDTIEYITDPDTKIPEGADYVCRSYFFYGTAGGTVANPNHEYLYFVVRVQRSLTAPYQQTVVISAPASLLSMETVLINETTSNGKTTYTATVQPQEPARVIYEVGLRSDINEHNVAQIVGGTTYSSEKAVDATGAQTINSNYDPSTGEYIFYTNDWDRTKTEASHERAMTHATFDAALDNPFYAYQEDTLIYSDNRGTVYTGTTAPTGLQYIAREVYTWTKGTGDEYEATATKSTVYIQIRLPDTPSDVLVQKTDGWYIPKGSYTGSTLMVTGDDVPKSPNLTGTSSVVAHPVRTEDYTNSHYTVYLGNNGKLTLKSVDTKAVTNVTQNITDADGKAVMVDDVLTYTIKVHNSEGSTATAVVTDTVPVGTELVAGSISHNGALSGNVITWNLSGLTADSITEVSFQVKVTEAALALIRPIENAASITINNNPAYTTNTTSNPPQGKTATNTGNQTITSIQVGQEIVYHINYANDTATAQTITVTDIVPQGTDFVVGSAYRENDTYADGAPVFTYDPDGDPQLTWVLRDVAAGTRGTVTFKVKVNASAKSPVENDAAIKIGTNDPQSTNKTTVTVPTGNLTVTKDVTAGVDTKTFTMDLAETSGKLNGTYTVTGNKGRTGTIVFTNGAAVLTDVAKDETVTISGLPAGVEIKVTERSYPGWNATYGTQTGTVPANSTVALAVSNAYVAQPVQFHLSGSKSFSGDNFPAGVTFTFRAEACYENGTVKTGDEAILVTATATSGNGTVTFTMSNRTFGIEHAGKTYYYKVYEADSDVTGVTEDSKAYLLKLELKDNGEGQMVATTSLKTGTKTTTAAEWEAMTWTVFDWSDNTPDVSFANTYAPLETTLTLGGTKTLDGRYIRDNEFSFELMEVVTENGQQVETPVSTALIKVDSTDPHEGTFTFDEITYTEEGEYTYIIREVDGGNGQIDYDDNYYQIVVTVADSNGQLTTSVSATKYNKDHVSQGAATAYTFGNTFTPSGVDIDLPGATKILSGEGADGLTAGEFSFTAYEALPSGQIGDYIEDGVIEEYVGTMASGTETTDGYSANITFEKLHFNISDMAGAQTNDDGNLEKKFYYVIMENIPSESAPGYNHDMKYDDSAYLVTITMVYDLENGELYEKENTRTVTEINGAVPLLSNSSNSIVFENIQNKPEVEVAPDASKVTTGANLPAGLSFSFRVTDLQGNFVGSGMSAATGNADSGVAKAVTFTEWVITSQQFETVVDANGNATFYYVISESNTASGNGIQYDPDKYIYQVTITRDENNKLKIADNGVQYHHCITNTDGTYSVGALINESDPDAAPVFNNTYSAQTYVNLTAVKEMTGMVLEANDFDFRLQRLMPNGQIADMVVNGANGADDTATDGKYSATVTFATLYFHTNMLTGYQDTTDGCYYINYLLTEAKPIVGAIPGVTYATNQYIVRVKLSNANGALKVENVELYTVAVNSGAYAPDTLVASGVAKVDDYNYTLSGAVFSNSYAPVHGDEAEIKANKVLDGRDLRAGEFTFELFYLPYSNGTYTPPAEEQLPDGTATNDANGNISFIRTYPANMPESFFTGDGDGNDDTATLVYLIREAKGNLGGVTYSDKEYYVKVVVRHDANSASLVVDDITYYVSLEDLANGTESSAVTFTNEYTTTTTSYTPVANKVLLGAVDPETGKRVELPMAANDFSFEVIELSKNNGGQWIEGNVVSTGNNKANDIANGVNTGEVTFSPINFSDISGQTGTHTHYYVIRETEGTAAGVTYSGEVYYLAVTIFDDGLGTLTVTEVTYYKAESAADAFDGIDDVVVYKHVYHEVVNNELEIENSIDGKLEEVLFTNHYGPGYILLDLGLNKAFQTSETHTPYNYVLSGSEFDFRVYSDEALTQEVTTGTNGASDANGVAKIIFGSIEIKKEQLTNGEGVFTYYVKEVSPRNSGERHIVIDDTVIKVTVTVKNDGFNNLSATYEYAKINSNTVADQDRQNTFINTYQPAGTSVTLDANKILTGKDLVAAEFEFKLYQVNSDGSETLLDTAKNGELDLNSDGKIDADELSLIRFQMDYKVEDFTGAEKNNGVFTKSFHYRLKESAKAEGQYGKYDCDETVYDITVTLTDNGRGQLVATKEIRVNGQSVDAVTFTNTYERNDLVVDLTVELGGVKTVVDANGDPVADYDLEGFKFSVMDVLNNEVSVGTSDVTGKIVFDNPLTYSAVGTYTYRIQEIPSGRPGVTDDGAVWEVHITVDYDDDLGQLKLGSVQMYKVGQHERASAPNISFSNTYVPAAADRIITLKKVLTGRDLVAGEFTFHMEHETDLGDVIDVESHNDAEGNITFPLHYTSAGTYNYVIREVKPDQPLGGVDYDPKTYNVTVVVTDDHATGKLVVADPVITDASGNPVTNATFTNSYEAASVDVTIEAIKVLNGRPMKPGEFSFNLKGSGLDKTVTNDASGNVEFPTITFDTVGEYTYKLTEVTGTAAGVTYDKTEYTVKVVVTDDLKGNLHAAVTYVNGETAVANPVFTNTYKGASVTADVQATKVLTGKDLAANEFQFQLVNKANATEVYTAKNDAEGKIVFEDLVFTETGTYTYTMTEVAGSDGNVTYDKTTYTVTITVTDDQTGKLVAAVSYDGKTPVFTNTYTPDAITVNLVGTKTLKGRDLKAEEFTFKAVDKDGKVVATGTNDAEGNIIFTGIVFDTEGELVLRVYEVNSAQPSIIYDGTTFGVKIVVTNVNGTLTAATTYTDGAIAFVNEYEAPVDDNPYTGDDTPVVMYAVLLVLSCVGMFAVVMLMGRKKHRYQR